MGEGGETPLPGKRKPSLELPPAVSSARGCSQRSTCIGRDKGKLYSPLRIEPGLHCMHVWSSFGFSALRATLHLRQIAIARFFAGSSRRSQPNDPSTTIHARVMEGVHLQALSVSPPAVAGAVVPSSGQHSVCELPTRAQRETRVESDGKGRHKFLAWLINPGTTYRLYPCTAGTPG